MLVGIGNHSQTNLLLFVSFFKKFSQDEPKPTPPIRFKGQWKRLVLKYVKTFPKKHTNETFSFNVPLHIVIIGL